MLFHVKIACILLMTNEVAVVAESHVLEHQVPPPNLPVAFRDSVDDEPLRADPCLVADSLGASRMVSWAALGCLYASCRHGRGHGYFPLRF